MKFKATKKQMRNGYQRIISIGYCDAQHLLNYEREIAYSAGSYGWACDYYDIDGVLISTGYSPLESRNAKHDYNTVREYDKKAQAIQYGPGSYEERKEQVSLLLREFVAAVTK